MIKKLLFAVFFTGILNSVYSQNASISPSNGNRGQSLPIVISGNNFSTQGTTITSVYLSQGSYILGQGSQTAAITNISVANPFTILADLHIPQNAPLGIYDLFVNAGTSIFSPAAFLVFPPANASIVTAPKGSKPGATVSVSVTVPGGNFKTQTQLIERVWLTKGTEIIDNVTNIAVVNSTTFTADINIPFWATSGLWDINVFTDDDMMYVSQDIFEINATFSREENQTAELSLYPNPASDVLMVEYGAQGSKLQLRIMDLTGKDVTEKIKFAEHSDKSVKADISELAEAVYMLQLIVDDEVIATRKFVKQ